MSYGSFSKKKWLVKIASNGADLRRKPQPQPHVLTLKEGKNERKEENLVDGCVRFFLCNPFFQTRVNKSITPFFAHLGFGKIQKKLSPVQDFILRFKIRGGERDLFLSFFL